MAMKTAAAAVFVEEAKKIVRTRMASNSATKQCNMPMLNQAADNQQMGFVRKLIIPAMALKKAL